LFCRFFFFSFKPPKNSISYCPILGVHYKQHKKNGEKNTVLNLSIHPSDLRYSSLKYIGKDVNDNIYWADTCAVAVFNKKGFLIEYFVPQKKENIITLPVVHPSGDIYYLASKYSKIKKSDKYSDDYYPVVGFYLYRVKNVWDPKGRARWYRESGVKDLRPISQNPGK